LQRYINDEIGPDTVLIISDGISQSSSLATNDYPNRIDEAAKSGMMNSRLDEKMVAKFGYVGS
jgi:hypothetical protein